MIDDFVLKMVILYDRLRYRFWLQYQNGSAELLKIYEAIDDAYDCLDSVHESIKGGDIKEARRLLLLSMARLREHADTIREQL